MVISLLERVPYYYLIFHRKHMAGIYNEIKHMTGKEFEKETKYDYDWTS